MSKAVAEKRRLWKAWKKGGSKEEYLLAKKASKKAVFAAKRAADDIKFSKFNEDSESIYKIAKQMKSSNQDVVGENCVTDDSSNLCLDTRVQKECLERTLPSAFRIGRHG